MKNKGTIDKSSLLFGLGTGIIIASIAWFLFILLSNPNNIYEENKVLEAAQQLMNKKETSNHQNQAKQQIVFNFDEEHNNQNVNNDDNNADDPQGKNVQDDQKNHINEKEDSINEVLKTKQVRKITVLPGDLCSDIDRKLYEAGLIEKENDFNKRMKELKLTTKINAGVFEFSPGEELDSIISRLVKSYRR